MKNQVIASHFSAAASVYEQIVQVQAIAAKKAVALFRDLSYDLPEGVIVDLGAGTGLLTKELAQTFANKPVIATDIAANMLEEMKRQTWFQASKLISTQTMDMSEPTITKQVSMFASSFSIQWVLDPIAVLQNYWDKLEAGGVMVISFPDTSSYCEWHAVCRDLNLPFQGNRLPDIEAIVAYFAKAKAKVIWKKYSYIETYDDIYVFFKNLKQIGANYAYNRPAYSASTMRQIIRTWNREYASKVTYQIGWLCLIKPSIT